MSGRAALRLSFWLGGLLVLPWVLAGEAPADGSFQDLLAEAGMQLVPPPGFQDREVQDSVQLPYERAMADTDGTLEVRYSIRPLGRIVVDYEDPHSAKPEPNHMFPLMFQAILGRIARHGHNPSTEYPMDQARDKFGADWAAAAVFDVDPEYSPEHSHGLLLALHKNQLADAYSVFLFHDYVQVKPLLGEALGALRFAADSPDKEALP